MPAINQTPAKKYKTSNNVQRSAKTMNQNNPNGEPVEVYCRLRNVDHHGKGPCVFRQDDTVVLLQSDTDYRQYVFSHVFSDSSTQKEVFDRVGLPLVNQLVRGQNGLLFTYGVTSSGKTYTIQGSPSNCGLLPRTIDVLFNSIQDQLCKEFQIKPDGRNFFKVQADPEWMFERGSNRNEKVNATPNKTPSLVKWLNRKKDSDIIDMELVNTSNVYCVFVSLVELYTYKRVVDLLDDPNIADRNKKKPTVIEDPNDNFNCFVANATEKEVRSADEALEVINKGLGRRTTARTALNHESSRSHCLFNIRLVQARRIDGETIDEGSLSASQLCLVDLAGMERQDRSEASGKTLNEASNINNTLMALRECIKALRDDRRSINIDALCRSDNLTRLFKSFFKGYGRIRIILCVNPKLEEYNENINALEFGAKAKEVVVPSSIKASQNHHTGIKRAYNFLNEDRIDLPLLDLDNPVNDEKFAAFFGDWINVLQQRKERKERYRAEILKKEQEFRINLVASENEKTLLSKEVEEKRKDMNLRRHQITQLEDQLDNFRRSKENQSCEMDNLKSEIASLQKKLSQKQRKFNLLQADIEAIENKARDEEREFLTRKFENLLRPFAQDNCCLSKKVDYVLRSINQKNSNQVVEDWPRTAPSAPQLSPLVPPSSVSSESNTPQPTTASSERMTLRSRSPIRTHVKEVVSPSYGVAVVNTKHIRSLSTGSSPWLYHRPSGTIKTGTVLSPKIKNKRSVTNIRSSDLLGRNAPENYCVTHQEADEDGVVKTSVFKGPIIPTRCHGVSVVINDVEVMQHVSPPSRKRTASDATATAITRTSPTSSHNVSDTEYSVKRTRRGA